MARPLIAALMLALLVSPGVQAEEDPAFAQLREAAMSPSQGGAVEGLGAFLERYIGECAREGGPDCRAHAKTFRSKASGKKFYLTLADDSLPPLQAAGSRGDRFTLLITPFFSEGGYALTQSAPRKVDAQGHPVMPFLAVQGHMPSDWDSGELARLVRTRGLKLELVFTPQEVWILPKKGGGRIYGVRAQVHGLSVQKARGGDVVARWPSK